ncbi:ABC transporter permease [Alisedimentitalea sp. MJ-SS2]|uniref:ABC transporter permease n=1 Tax=Aliisedimentitalea sp. MJ-SS2 TaxID=3049795 RepID=UPI0029109ABA|nr:ABC transporter permease [Alisedimentitalea sp. MJ-SS2]MDU8926761.1 ABC transporter permease [Alisedimentitalea sp. MJ-SS2]
MKSFLSILTVVAAIIGLWYAACVPMNIHEAAMQAQRAGAEVTPETAPERRKMGRIALMVKNPQLWGTVYAQDRPQLPAPHQVGAELWKTTWGMVEKGRAFSKRSLLLHGWITLSATLLGFAFGTLLGIVLAVSIVHSRAMDMSVMPWIIASQTVPILAIAPMIVVVLAALQVDDLIAKGVISMYLSFFPVVVGMVKGLRSPDGMQMDQMRTWYASRSQTFWKLRLPSSMPYLFASLKVGVAASLIGAVVAELSLSQNGGLGARLLAGSYYGQTVQIWSALLAAAALAAVLVWAIGVAQNITLKRMGFTR